MIMSDDVIFGIAIAKAATIIVSATCLLIYLAGIAVKDSSTKRDK